MTHAPAPPATLTFLFSDIEDSTRLWEEHPEPMREALGRHDQILRESIERAGGEVVKDTGDGVMAVFGSAGDCLRACAGSQLALRAQAWGATGPLLVRMGIHTGEVVAADGDYHGPTVNRAARIMAAGHGGQVLLSSATRALIGSDLPSAWSLRDLGEQRLKGVAREERIFQLVHPELPAEFPELSTAARRVQSLPAEPSAFVGRVDELGQLIERLREADVRLMTLTGPGGIGKTRLALQAARELEAEHDAVVFVDLASAFDRASALLTVARAVGLADGSEDAQLERLVAALRDRRYLLVLDNFEHVTGAAPAVAELLRQAPGLRAIATSREPLHLRSEHIFRVPPLGLPAPAARPQTAGDLGAFEAIRFFVERARAVRPDFRLTDDNAAAVLEICQRLDGLPLAIELATARIGIFSPEALRDRLGRRLDLLRGGARDLPERQQTLRAAIEWSHQLLEPFEQELFRLLAVYDGAGVEDIESVTARLSDRVSALDPVETLVSLADKSLLRQTEDATGAARFGMLETIHEFALERLEADAGLAAAARRAHAEHFAEVALQQAQGLRSTGRDTVLLRMAPERANLAACWRYWVEARALDRLDGLIDALWPLYDAMGWYRETLALASDMLDTLAGTPMTAERARTEAALHASVARVLMVTDGFTDRVEEAYARALDLVGTGSEAGQQLPVLRGLAHFHLYRAEFDQAAEIGRRVLALGEVARDSTTEAQGRLIVGSNLMFSSDLDGGLRELDRARALFEAHGYRPGRYGLGTDPRVAVLTTSAFGYWLRGQVDDSRAWADRALELAASLDHLLSLAYARYHSGLLHIWRGEPEIARERALGVLEAADEAELHIFDAIGTCLLGAATAALGDADTGLAQLQDGIGLYRGLTTPPVFWPNLLVLDAWACHRAGRAREGLALMAEAATAWGDARSPMLPEPLILRGDLLAQVDAADPAAGQSWTLALEVANEFGAHLPALRAALRLARSDAATAADRGRWLAALAEIYARLDQPLEYPDFVAARALLEAG